MGTTKICDCCKRPATETDVKSAWLTEEGFVRVYPNRYGRGAAPPQTDLCVSCFYRLDEMWQKCADRMVVADD